MDIPGHRLHDSFRVQSLQRRDSFIMVRYPKSSCACVLAEKFTGVVDGEEEEEEEEEEMSGFGYCWIWFNVCKECGGRE